MHTRGGSQRDRGRRGVRPVNVPAQHGFVRSMRTRDPWRISSRLGFRAKRTKWRRATTDKSVAAFFSTTFRMSQPLKTRACRMSQIILTTNFPRHDHPSHLARMCPAYGAVHTAAAAGPRRRARGTEQGGHTDDKRDPCRRLPPGARTGGHCAAVWARHWRCAHGCRQRRATYGGLRHPRAADVNVPASRQAGRQADRQGGRDRQTDRQTGRQTDRQTERQTDR